LGEAKTKEGKNGITRYLNDSKIKETKRKTRRRNIFTVTAD